MFHQHVVVILLLGILMSALRPRGKDQGVKQIRVQNT